MHINYSRSKILIVILSALFICLSIIPETAGCEEYDLYAASYKTYDTTYNDILKMYLRVIPAHVRGQSRRRHDLYNEFIYDDLSSVYMEGIMTPEYEKMDEASKQKKKKELQEKTLRYIKNTVGFSIQDINGDGIDELIIGSDKSYIYEIFTLDSGKVRELVKAGYRSSCNLLADGTMLRSSHLSGGHTTDILFQMNGTDKVQFVKGYVYYGPAEYEMGYDPDDCWFSMKNEKDYYPKSKEQHVPESEARSWISKCESQLANIRFIPLAAYEKGLSADGLAVLSKDGKTTGSQKINIRKKADSKSKIVAKKNVGTYVTITGEEGEYYLITVDKKTGYIHKDYITVITEPAE